MRDTGLQLGRAEREMEREREKEEGGEGENVQNDRSWGAPGTGGDSRQTTRRGRMRVDGLPQGSPSGFIKPEKRTKSKRHFCPQRHHEFKERTHVDQTRVSKTLHKDAPRAYFASVPGYRLRLKGAKRTRAYLGGRVLFD